jgi:CHAT domain-containing protein
MRAHAHATARPGPVLAVAGPRLERADDEAQSVATIWPGGRSMVGSGATGERVLAAMDGARIVHVAAHGHHQPDSPLFSAITLFDGPLVGYDLERLRRPPQQVVLSACDLGQATVRPGDEALGLTRAFLHSGTATVISGVAKVSDRGAAELMVDYHRRLAADSPPAHALADALAMGDEPLPFVCFGAGW